MKRNRESVVNSRWEKKEKQGRSVKDEEHSYAVQPIQAKNGYFTLFENIYLPNFTAKTAAEQKLILASAKQRVVVADVADKVYEDFLSLYLPAEKLQKHTVNWGAYAQ